MSQLMVVSMLLFFGLTVPVAVSIGLATMAGVGFDGHMTDQRFIVLKSMAVPAGYFIQNLFTNCRYFLSYSIARYN